MGQAAADNAAEAETQQLPDLLQTQASPAKGPAPMQVESSGEERLQQLLNTLDGQKASEIRAALRRAGTEQLGQATPDEREAREPHPKQEGQEAVGLPSVLSMAEDSSSIIAIVVVAMRLVYRMLAKHEMAT